MNVPFEYLYRAAGNYKNRGEVIFSNTDQVEIARLEEEIRDSIFDREFFVAEDLGMPILYFQNFDRDLDHGLLWRVPKEAIQDLYVKTQTIDLAS